MLTPAIAESFIMGDRQRRLFHELMKKDGWYIFFVKAPKHWIWEEADISHVTMLQMPEMLHFELSSEGFDVQILEVNQLQAVLDVACRGIVLHAHPRKIDRSWPVLFLMPVSCASLCGRLLGYGPLCLTPRRLLNTAIHAGSRVVYNGRAGT